MTDAVLFVLSERSGNLYAVDLERGLCDCPARTFRPWRLCRHLRAASERFAPARNSAPRRARADLQRPPRRFTR